MADNRRKRGREFQLWIKKWIEETYPGAAVHNQPMNHVAMAPGRWICVSNDIFGCIDLIAVTSTGLPIYIQATRDRGVARKLEALSLVPWNLEHMKVQVWLKRSPTRVSIKELAADGELHDVGEIVRRKYVPRQ